jgi:hypothetical protein
MKDVYYLMKALTIAGSRSHGTLVRSSHTNNYFRSNSNSSPTSDPQTKRNGRPHCRLARQGGKYGRAQGTVQRAQIEDVKLTRIQILNSQLQAAKQKRSRIKRE